MKRIGMIILFLGIPLTSYCIVLHVPDEYATIQDGINAAADGDTVLVADGIYTGEGNRGLTFLGKTIVLISQDGYENTIIDCEYLNCGIRFENEETNSSVIKGFTIKNGFFENGGGIYCYQASPTITKCNIFGNIASDSGGGIYCYKASPQILECKMSGNLAAGYGGGIRFYNTSSPMLSKCIINGNESGRSGGGISSSWSTLCIKECMISNNVGGVEGGGIHFYGVMTDTLRNCTISGNTANLGAGMYTWSSDVTTENAVVFQNSGAKGGAFYFDWNSLITIKNCTAAYNEIISDGGGIYYHDAYLYVINSIFWENENQQIYKYGSGFADVQYSDISGGYSGEGNIDANPFFINPSAQDFRISSFSECVDAGTPEGAPNTDFEGDTRPWGEGYDIGADEYTHDGPWITPSPSSIEVTSVSTELDSIEKVLTISSAGTNEGEYELLPGNQEFYYLEGELSGVLFPGEIELVTVNFDTTGVSQGVYRDTLTFRNLQSSQSHVLIPITLCVYSHGVIRVPDHIISIGQAVEVAVDGDTVLVSDGTYCGARNRDIDLTWKSIDLISENGSDRTVIDCEYLGRGFILDYVIGQHNLVRGFQIVQGRGNTGGGGYFSPYNAEIRNCVFKNNHAIKGGGVYAYTITSASLSRCIFINNCALNGGGVYLYGDGEIKSIGCTYMQNIADFGGGLFGRYSAAGSIINCTIIDNLAHKDGGGITCENTTISCVNNILWGNSPQQIVENNNYTLTVSYSDIEGGWPGEGNIDENPQFVAPYKGDFRLKSDSPCIDAGDPLFGVPLGGGSRIDMGAYEYWFGWNVSKQNSGG